MAVSYLRIRQESLRRAQNPDGGWGYFSGKQSWLEPTVYSALVLHGEPAADRAWQLLRGWQASDGSLRPSGEVAVKTWGTALWLTLAAARGESGEPVARAVRWLLRVEGVESSLMHRLAERVGLYRPDMDISLSGWPWTPESSSWVEPTSHSILALKKFSGRFSSSMLRERVRMGEARLIDMRCSDGGWNFGRSTGFGISLPAYPETTGVALVGLQGALQGRVDLAKSLDLAEKLAGDRASPLARAWPRIALRVHGRSAPEPSSDPPPADLHELALEALAAPEGNHSFFRTT